MSLIALEFDEDRLLVTTGRAAANKLSVTSLLEIELEEKSNEDIGETLKSHLQKIGAPKSEAIAIVSRSATEIRELTVPPAPEDELPDMIRFQARKEFASLGDDWALDYIPLYSAGATEGNATQEPSRTVLAAALTPELTVRLTAICQAANIKLKRILLRPFAALDLLEGNLADGKLRLIVDQNNETTDLSVVEGQNLLVTRTVRVPKELSADKRSKQLISEVRRTLAFARTATGGRLVEHVVVSGEPARNRHLAGDLSGPLKMEVQFLHPFRDANLETELDVDGVESPGRYMATLGGLVKELSGTRPAIDFLNPRRPIVKQTDYTKYYYYAALAAGIALIALFFSWWKLSQQTNEIVELRAERDRKMRLNEGDDNTPSVEQRLAEVGKIDQWKMEEVNWLVELSEFSKRYLLPDDVIADSFTAALRRDSPATIDLSGRIVDDLSKTAELLGSLSARPYSVEPIDTGVDTSDRDSKLTSTFEYQIKLRRDETTETNPMLDIDRKALAYLRLMKEKTETEVDTP